MDTAPPPQSPGAKDVSRAVAAALSDAGVSRREASARTGISLTTLTRRLTGGSPLTVTELAALAEVAHTTVVEVLIRARSDNGSAA